MILYGVPHLGSGNCQLLDGTKALPKPKSFMKSRDIFRQMVIFAKMSKVSLQYVWKLHTDLLISQEPLS